MSRYLFAVSIGPVQEFIAAARRMRDLWMGSTLLSELSKAAAREVRSQGAELVFPAPANDADLEPGSDLAVANKLLFVLESNDVAAVVKRLQQVIQARLREFADEGVRNASGYSFDDEAMKAQLENLLEVFAVWVKYPRDADYSERHTAVERLLAARKGLRNFGQHNGSSREKSTIDGVREDVIFAPAKRNRHQIKEGEKLDAVAVVKRFATVPGGEGGAHAPRFSSTQDIGALPYARRLLLATFGDAELAGDLRRYVELVERLEATPQPFLEGFGRASLARLLKPEDESEPPELGLLRRRLHRRIKPTPPYYATLIADGDHMGKAIDERHTSEAHRELSGQLASFAMLVRRRIETVQEGLRSGWGTVIYAGGDDLLAFAPLDTALDAASAANNAFEETGLPEPLSLSAALVIAHAREDLTVVLEWAHRTLAFAKEKCGRSALAVTLLRRSGSPFTIGGHWAEFLPQIRMLLEAYQGREVPFGLGYELRLVAERCRTAKIAPELVLPLTMAVLRQKTDTAASRLKEVANMSVYDARGLTRFANLLVLAKALCGDDTAVGKAPLEAMR